VIARWVERRAIFRDDTDREKCLRRLALVAEEEAKRLAAPLSAEKASLYDDALTVVRALVQIRQRLKISREPETARLNP
jgi:hypothetical protein